MVLNPAGSQWLKEHYNLTGYNLTHCSYIGNKDSIELTNKGNTERVYRHKYAPAQDTPLHHLEFSLKYDDLSLDFLIAVFEKTTDTEIVAFIESAPSGKYTRKIGFLFEFLTGRQLLLTKPVTGNYIDLLETNKYFTGNGVKNIHWRINNNLLGVPSFCPIVRKTKIVSSLIKQDIPGKIEQLKENFPPDIFRRAINYLYSKETRSSYAIEKEQPSPDRMEKFIALLAMAGTEEASILLDEKRLVQLQNAIVDQRFAAEGFRDFQNYIGQTLPGYHEMVHYICPPPSFLHSLMTGLKETAFKTTGVHAAIRAAIISFGFVLIHPFEDGNGRLHRFIIHDILVHDGIVPKGLIIPVSAHMLNNIKDYDAVLEKYSVPLMQRIKYTPTEEGGIEVTNEKDTEGYYRYPDLTEHCIYLLETIYATLQVDMPEELLFIQRYDEAKKALQYIVDMPDKDINLMITFLHQNKGVLPKRRREKFARLTDGEILKMQAAFREIFEMVD